MVQPGESRYHSGRQSAREAVTVVARPASREVLRSIMERIMRVGSVLLSVVFAAGCGAEGGDGSGPDAMPPIPDASLIPDAMPLPDLPLAPTTLLETGLFTDMVTKEVNPAIREFTPKYELWTDGAFKKRWVYLPPNSKIDTSDMDFWLFPVGTRLWKEFSIDGTRVETRFFYKTSNTNWYVRTYVWNETQDEALENRRGVPDALGTGHDVPEMIVCEKCHGQVADSALGFSAVLLDHDGPGWTLASLVAEERLSAPPAGSAPFFPIPGDQIAQDALGYVHSNCGGCHHAASGIFEAGDALIELRLEVDSLGSVEDTRFYQTTVCADTIQSLRDYDGNSIEKVVIPGNPAASAMFHRMNIRGSDQMPEIGTNEVDPDGSRYVSDWIYSLAGCPQ